MGGVPDLLLGRRREPPPTRLGTEPLLDANGLRLPPTPRPVFDGTRSRPPGNPILDRGGSSVDSRYTHFASSDRSSALEEFDNERQNYHDFGGAHGFNNGSHSLSAPGSRWRCLVDDQ